MPEPSEFGNLKLDDDPGEAWWDEGAIDLGEERPIDSPGSDSSQRRWTLLTGLCALATASIVMWATHGEAEPTSADSMPAARERPDSPAVEPPVDSDASIEELPPTKEEPAKPVLASSRPIHRAPLPPNSSFTPSESRPPSRPARHDAVAAEPAAAKPAAAKPAPAKPAPAKPAPAKPAAATTVAPSVAVDSMGSASPEGLDPDPPAPEPPRSLADLPDLEAEPAAGALPELEPDAPPLPPGPSEEDAQELLPPGEELPGEALPAEEPQVEAPQVDEPQVDQPPTLAPPE